MSGSGAIPQTRFSVAGTAASFWVRKDPRTGAHPDWQFDPGRRTRKIPGANRSVTWFDGYGLSTITLSVWCDDRAAYRALLAMTGQTGDLHLLAGFTSHEGDRYHHPADGRDYERYGATTLLEAPANVRHRIGGAVECELTFGRAFAPVFVAAAVPAPIDTPREVLVPVLLYGLDGSLAGQDGSGATTASGIGAIRWETT